MTATSPLEIRVGEQNTIIGLPSDRIPVYIGKTANPSPVNTPLIILIDSPDGGKLDDYALRVALNSPLFEEATIDKIEYNKRRETVNFSFRLREEKGLFGFTKNPLIHPSFSWDLSGRQGYVQHQVITTLYENFFSRE